MEPKKINLDFSFIIRLLVKKKYIVILLFPIILYIFLLKEARKDIYFETYGLIYIAKESKLFGLRDDVLKKIIPEYDAESEKEYIDEYIRSIIVLSRTIAKSGFNVFFHSDEENYKPKEISIYKWLFSIKNIYNLRIRNIYENYKISNSYIKNDRLKKITLKIIFNNNTVEIFDLNGKKIGFLNLEQNNIFENDEVSFKIEKINFNKVYDRKVFLTIVNQNYMSDEVGKKVRIFKKKSSSMVKVYFKDMNPFLAKSFTDTLMKEFLKYNIEIKVKNINKINDFLKQELKELKDRRDQYLHKIYQVEKNIKFHSSEKRDFLLSSLLVKYYEKKDQLKLYISQLKFFKEQLKKNKLKNMSFFDDKTPFTAISKLVDSLVQEIIKFNNTKEQFTKFAPQYKKQLNKIKFLKEKLKVEIDFKINELNSQIEKMDILIRGNSDKILLNALASRKIDFLFKEIKIIDAIREDIYIQQKNLMLNRVFIRYGNRVLREARLKYNISNPISNKVLANIIISFLLSVIIVIIKYLLFPVFYSKMEIPNKDQIIGGIPNISDKMLRKGIIKFSKDNRMFELFRLLLSMMILENKNMKIILFTSSYPMDGRTFAAMNFATIIALSGKKKVLVITVHPIKTKTSQAIYSFNEVLDFESKSEKVFIETDLFFYRFNCISKNFDKNIDINDIDNEIYSVVKKLKEKCDFIIFDCLAYPMYADTFLYASSSDMVISLLRLNHTPIKIFNKHINDLNKYVKDYKIIINSDRVNLNSSGYILDEKGTIEYYKEKIKYMIAKL